MSRLLSTAPSAAFLVVSFVFHAIVDHAYGRRRTGSRTQIVVAY